MSVNRLNAINQPVKVTILATQKLVSDYLNVLLRDDHEISVIDYAYSLVDLREKISQNMPEVILICIVDGEGKNLEAVSEVLAISPEAKILILFTPDSQLDQPASLKLGVAGIVGTNQNIKVLTRAIKQISDGGVWLNQKLVEQLLHGSYVNSNGGSKSSDYLKLNELTNRELEVIEMVGKGMNNKDISKNLCISEATIRHHLSSIYSKLAIEDRLNLAIYAYRRQIVCPPAVTEFKSC